MFKKLFLLIFSCLIIISCGGKNYKVETYKNQIPKWYVVDKVDENKVFGKALGESTSLELANREAEALAVSNVIFKIKQEMSAIKNQYLSKKFSQKGKNKISSTQSDYEEKIELAITKYEISSYRVSDKSIYKDPNGFKVFVEIEFNKQKLFESLDKII
jgi:hypothetical protein